MAKYVFPYELLSDEHSPPHHFADREPSLWRAVITQALMDAASQSQKPETRKQRCAAIEWLRGDSEDFLSVCEYADLDPAYIREQAALALARGCVWRLPAGLGWRAQQQSAIIPATTELEGVE